MEVVHAAVLVFRIGRHGDRRKARDLGRGVLDGARIRVAPALLSALRVRDQTRRHLSSGHSLHDHDGSAICLHWKRTGARAPERLGVLGVFGRRRSAYLFWVSGLGALASGASTVPEREQLAVAAAT